MQLPTRRGVRALASAPRLLRLLLLRFRRPPLQPLQWQRQERQMRPLFSSP
jgi:hypothetical protein